VLGAALLGAAATTIPLVRPSAAMAAPLRLPAGADTTGPMAFWPTHPFYSHKLLRTIGKSNSGAADFTEAYIAAQAIGGVPTDDAMVREFSRLGTALLGRAAAIEQFDPQTAAAARLRATEYLRTAEFCIHPDTQLSAKVALYRKLRHTFAQAVADARPRVTPVNVPYRRSALYAYWVDPLDAPHRRPHATVILYGGLDSLGEEVYLWVGRELARRGLGVLVVDGPGQGASLRLRRIPSRPDYEVATKAVVDYLVAQRQVDRRRIGLIGISLGGYYAARSAAFERRLRATVAWTGIWNALTSFQAQHDPDIIAFFARQGQWVLGANTPIDAYNKLERFHMADVVGGIRRPILITHGEDDDLAPVHQAQQLYDAIRAPKTLHIFPSRTPGCTHCQVDSLPTAWEVVLPWLLDHLDA
jgi:dienelactone hydrolase